MNVQHADANGFYSVEEGIRMGKLLAEYRSGLFEEPVMFDWHEETRQVAEARSVPIAGGEQENSLHGFHRLIINDALQIVQPDTRSVWPIAIQIIAPAKSRLALLMRGD